MLDKPTACQGCPLFGSGRGFVPDELHEAALVTILMQNPGADEESGRQVVGLDERGRPHYAPCSPRPAIGRTGYYMDSKFLPLAELERGTDVSVCNVLKCRMGKTNDLPTGAVLKRAVEHCTKAHLQIPKATRLIVAQGGLAWDWTQNQVGLPETKKLSISKWRGHVGPSYVARSVTPTLSVDSLNTAMVSPRIPVLAVLHLADLFRDRRMELPSRSDWKRVPQFLSSRWPRQLAPRLVVSSETSDDSIQAWFETAMDQAPWVAVDLEFVPESKFLTIVGVGYPIGDTITGAQLEWSNGDIPKHLKGVFVRGLLRLLTHKTMVGWNLKDAELPVLKETFNFTPPSYEDGMLAHACAWSELPHDLDFCCSVYSDYEKPFKRVVGWGISKNWGDVVGTVECWKALLTTMKADPFVEKDYREQRLPLIPWLMDTEARGLRVNRAFVVQAWDQYQRQMQEAQFIAEAYCGWPINLGSPAQLAHWLYDVEQMPKQTFKRKVSTNDDAIAALREQIEPLPDYDSETGGVTVEGALARIQAEASPILESRVVFAGARQCTSHYLALCLLPDRADHRRVGLNEVRTRIFPKTAIHTQANGRWSMTNPPMQQLPVRPLNLRNLVLPDEGGCWIHWDWKKAEPHLQMATMNSRFLKNVLGQNWDLNTIYLCNLMGWPLPQDLTDPHSSAVDADWRAEHQWKGSDDTRRRLVKTSGLAMDYGKSDLSTIPGIYKLGLSKQTLKRGGDLMLQADPDKRQYITTIKQRVAKGENISRDWTGARRVFLGSVGDARVREWLNHPFQRGVASALNYAAGTLWRELASRGRLDWTMHDAGWFWTSRETLSDTFKLVQHIVSQPLRVGQQHITIPSSWTIIDDHGQEHTPKELGLNDEMDDQNTKPTGLVLDAVCQLQAAHRAGAA